MYATFAYELRRQREARGLSQDEIAKDLYIARPTFQSYEGQRQVPDESFARQLDDYFGTGELFQALWFHAQREHLKEWLEQYLGLEDEALQIRTFHPLIVPGLFQTEAYAAALMRAGYLTDIDERLERRISRQRILSREDPPLFWTIIDEAVLLRPVGGPDVMKAQFAHLLELAAQPHVSLQVVAMSAGPYLGQDGPYLILQLPGRSVAFCEAQMGGRLIQDPLEVSSLGVTHDRIRGKALPVADSLALITKAMEGIT